MTPTRDGLREKLVRKRHMAVVLPNPGLNLLSALLAMTSRRAGAAYFRKNPECRPICRCL